MSNFIVNDEFDSFSESKKENVAAFLVSMEEKSEIHSISEGIVFSPPKLLKIMRIAVNFHQATAGMRAGVSS